MGINILEGGRECRCHNGGSKQKRSCEGQIHCAIEANEIARTEREGLAGGMFNGDYLGCTHVSTSGWAAER